MIPVMSGRPSSQSTFSIHVQNVLKTLRLDKKKTEIELNKIIAKAKERRDLYLSATVLALTVLLVTTTLYDFNVWIFSIILFSLAVVIKFEDVTNYLYFMKYICSKSFDEMYYFHCYPDPEDLILRANRLKVMELKKRQNSSLSRDFK